MPWLTIKEIRSQVKQNRHLTPMYNLMHATKQKPVYPPGELRNDEGDSFASIYLHALSAKFLHMNVRMKRF